MKKHSLIKEILKCALVLAIIAGISGLSLGFVNQVTFVSEEEKVSRSLNKFFTGTFTEVYETEVATVYEGVNGDETFYVATAEGQGGYSGTVPMFVKFVDGVIKEVHAGTNKETIKTPFGNDFISVFLDKDIAEISGFAVGGGDDKIAIDKISGATKSSNAITDAVDKCVDAMQKMTEAK